MFAFVLMEWGKPYLNIITFSISCIIYEIASHYFPLNSTEIDSSGKNPRFRTFSNAIDKFRHHFFHSTTSEEKKQQHTQSKICFTYETRNGYSSPNPSRAHTHMFNSCVLYLNVMFLFPLCRYAITRHRIISSFFLFFYFLSM